MVPQLKLNDENIIEQQIICCVTNKRKLSKIISKKLNHKDQKIPRDCKVLFGEAWFCDKRMKEHADLIGSDLLPLITDTQIEILRRNPKWYLDSSFEASLICQSYYNSGDSK